MEAEQSTSPQLVTVEGDQQAIDSDFPPAITVVGFNSHGKRLNGILYQANGPGPHPTVLLLHGYPGTELNADLAQTMRRSGYNVLIFHYRGAWGSDGDFSFSHMIEDVVSAANFLRAEHGDYRVDADRLMLIGHSMGGFAALQVAARDAAIRCVAGIASADLGLISKVIAADIKTATEISASADNLTMLKGWSGEQALADIRANAKSFDVAALAPKLSGKSVLLIAADKDSLTPPEAFHDPMVAAYKAQGDIELTHAKLSGDHFFSWSRFALIDRVMKWAKGCEPPR